MSEIKLSHPTVTRTGTIFRANFFPTGSSKGFSFFLREPIQRYLLPTLIIQMWSGAKVSSTGDDATRNLAALDDALFPVYHAPVV